MAIVDTLTSRKSWKDALPAEIRREIWLLAFPDVILYAANIHSDGHRVHMVAMEPSPITMSQVCFEAREIARTKYSRVPFQIDRRDGGRSVDLLFSKRTLVFLGPQEKGEGVLGRLVKPAMPGLRFVAMELKRTDILGRITHTVMKAAQHPGITDIVVHRSAWKRCPEPSDSLKKGGDRHAGRLAEALGWYLDSIGLKKDGPAGDEPLFYGRWREYFQEFWTRDKKKEPMIHFITESDGWPGTPERWLPPFDNLPPVIPTTRQRRTPGRRPNGTLFFRPRAEKCRR